MRVHVFAVTQMLVDDAALSGVHCWQIDRALIAQSLLSGLFGLLLELFTAAVAVAGSIDLNADPLAVCGIALDDPRRKMLHSVDRLTVLTDEEPEVISLERPCDCIVVDHNLNLGVEIESVDDLLKQFECPLLCLFRCSP